METKQKIQRRNQEIRQEIQKFEETIQEQLETRKDTLNELEQRQRELQPLIEVETEEIPASDSASNPKIVDNLEETSTIKVEQKPEELENIEEEIQQIQTDILEQTQQETGFQFLGRTLEPVMALERAQKGELLTISPNEKVQRLETENYKDYFANIKEQLNLEQPEAAYLGAGSDYLPALKIGGNWDYLGLDYQEKELSPEDLENQNGEDWEYFQINMVESDVKEETPKFDEEKELILLKTVGSGWGQDPELKEGMLQTAHENLEDNGYLLSSYEDLDTELFTYERPIEPELETVSNGVAGGYTFKHLHLFKKN